ncbi:hypothetical protein [uncultured Methanospirillum sp.]|uniref:hypothetical protein n=1 Tax=uncultured Methanospirillum sp. TaxID=262503 RepID=UPI0029C8D905|nr:hypothetical protein [uncultured Methanospirillum sp.]
MNRSDTNTIYCLSAYLLTTIWLSTLVAAGVFAHANGLPWISLPVSDFKNRRINLTLPLQRIVILDSSSQIIMAAYALKILPLLAGVDEDSAKNDNFFPVGPLCPVVGPPDDPDIALISRLDPDLVLVGNLSDEIISKMEQAHLCVASVSVFPNQSDGCEVVDISQMLDSVLGELQTIPERFDWIV